MRTAAIVFALLLTYAGPALAQEAVAGPNPQTPVSTSSPDCKTKLISAVPLALNLTPQGVLPAVPDEFGIAAHLCVGSAPVAPAMLPFGAGYPYPSAWWTTGAYPFPLPVYHGT